MGTEVADVEALPRRPGGDDPPADARLVLAHMGELGTSTDIAHRVQPVAIDPGDAQIVAHFDRPGGRQAEALETEPFAVGAATRRNDELIGPHAPTRGELDHHLAPVPPALASRVDLVPLHAHDALGEAKVDAARNERVGDECAGEGLVAGEQALAPLHERDLGTKARQPGGRFAGDDATAEDHHAGGDLVAVRHVARGPGPGGL